MPLEVVPPRVGFEDPEHGQGCLHVDFANKYLGGGILCGGCVQEEIRFAICPELTVACLFCPVMGNTEAIQVIGAQQYCSYTGYGYSLRFGGDFVDESERDKDGTVLNGIAAIDALDGRGGVQGRRFDIPAQLRPVHHTAIFMLFWRLRRPKC